MKQTFTTLFFLCTFIILKAQPVLPSFTLKNGGTIYADVVQAADGKLYGTSDSGGIGGIIFSFDPSTSVYTKVKDLNLPAGSSTVGSLMKASDGKLYGLTSGITSDNGGSILSFDPATSDLAIVKTFNEIDGYYPGTGLIQGRDGKLYGTTGQGGGGGLGVIFSFDPVSSSYAKLRDMDGQGFEASRLFQASDGKLYGMTRGGGSHWVGGIFSFDPVTSIYTVLKDFDFYTGYGSSGGFVEGSDGKLYGTKPFGGYSEKNVLFSFDPATAVYTVLKSPAVNYSGWGAPIGSLVLASDGKFYGTTQRGGSNNQGAIYSFDPVTSVLKMEGDFDASHDPNPFDRELIEVKNVNITTAPLRVNSIFTGSSLTVRFAANGSFNTDNIFTAQLSNAAGSFENPVNIGSITSATGDTILCVIPVSTAPGTGYRIRVVASDQSIKVLDNGSDIIIKRAPVALYRINAGGPQVTNSLGTFAADTFGFPAPGNSYSTTNNIKGTAEGEMYQTERFGANNSFSYAFPLSNGHYTVVLHFAEIYWLGVGQRIFDVSIEGNKVLDDYDIVRKVDAFTATSETFPVTVTDGILNIDFSSLPADGGIDQPKVSAIEVLADSEGTEVKAGSAITARKAATTTEEKTITKINFNTLSAYPNPGNNGHYTVSLSKQVEGKIFYTLLSLTGTRMSGGTLLLQKPTSLLNFDFSREMSSSGIYFLQLEGKDMKGQIKLMRIK